MVSWRARAVGRSGCKSPSRTVDFQCLRYLAGAEVTDEHEITGNYNIFHERNHCISLPRFAHSIQTPRHNETSGPTEMHSFNCYCAEPRCFVFQAAGDSFKATTCGKCT
ncbi:unnamed protein product [Ectocarpus sp. 8 AP-2014]